jgi:hypothetical protein
MSDLQETMSSLVDKFFWDSEKKHNCAATVLLAMAEYYGIKNELIPSIANAFGGGYAGTHRSVCGGVSGGLMVIGIKVDTKPGDIGQEMLSHVTGKYGSFVCDKILGIDFDDKDQVAREKDPKRLSICTPMLRDICVWLAERLE